MIARVESMFDVISEAGTPLVVIAGPTGVGRTTLLTQLGKQIVRHGNRVSAMRFTPESDVLPARLSARPEPADKAAPPAGPGRTESIWASIGPVESAHSDPAVARRAAASIAASLQRSDSNSVFLIDDAQWMDRDSLAVLEALVRRLAGSSVSCVCTIRTPVPELAGVDGLAALRRLRHDGLVHSVRLRPLSKEGIARQVITTLEAAPDAALVTRLHKLSRGIPAALRDAIEMLRRNGSIQVIDRQAYLVRGTVPDDPPQDNQLMRAVHALGPAVWDTAKAAASLAPLGSAVPKLVGEVLGIPEAESTARLDVLRREGILHRGRSGRSWRFTIPQVAAALIASSGPFERQQFAAKAVTAVWTGVAECDDPEYLTDQVADSGRLVDSRRALADLFSHSAAIKDEHAESALRWLVAAVELTENRQQRMMILLMHASTCHFHGRYDESLRGARLLLTDFADQLSPGTAQELQVMAVSAMNSVNDIESLTELGEGRQRWPGGDDLRIVTQALALGMLDRWVEAREVLSTSESTWRAGNPTSAMSGDLLHVTAALWTGDQGPFERSLAGRGDWPLRAVNRHRVDQVNAHVSTLLITGDLRRAEKLLIDEEFPPESLQSCSRVMLAALRGDFDGAIDTARRSLAGHSAGSFDPGYAGMLHITMEALVAQGKLTAARELVVAARTTTPILAHLLDLAEAQLDRALGDTEGAVSRLRASLEATAEHGVVVGLDLAWSELADLLLEGGDLEAAEHCLANLERITKAMPTSRGLLQALFVRATVRKDPTAAEQCLRIARERGQPFELGRMLAKLVKHGVADPAGLSEAYDTLAGVGGLLYRARTRSLMREHAIAVPGRQETVNENEYLLAVLVSEGLSNKQLAAALRTSEKSVEGRLSRLALRTGYRSRIELSTAMLNGDFGA
jgi:DNA-binding CsgD family transcriptional regulator